MSHQIDNKGLEIIEKNQKEIMQLESTVTEMKIHYRGSTEDLTCQKNQ